MTETTTWRRNLMWFCAACFYGFQFILRVSPSVIANDLMDSLKVDACALGIMIAWYYTGYALMQIPTGLILDRYGVRWPLSLACILCSVGALMFTYGEGLTALSIGRGCMGVGSAFGFLSCVKVSSQNFTPQKMALFVSLTMVVGTLGGTSGGAPFGKLVSVIGWREAYQMTAFTGIALSLIILIAFHNVRIISHKEAASMARSENVLGAVIDILKNPQTWIYGLYGFMMYVPLSGFADLWATPFVEKTFQVDRTAAGGIVSMFYIGLALGATLWSAFVSKVESYKRAMFWSAILTGLFVCGVIYLPSLIADKTIAMQVTYFMMAFAGAASAGQFIAFASITALNPSHRTATASGVHNMLCMFSGVVMLPLIGAVLDMVSPNLASDVAERYSSQDFQIALSLIPLSVVIAALCMNFVQETYPQALTRPTAKRPRSNYAKA